MIAAAIGWRDLLMVLLGVAAIPLTLYSAYYGLLAYCGLSFLRPQSMVFTTAVSEARFTFAVGIVLIFRAMISPGARFRLMFPTLVFLAFWAWMLLCTVLSDYPKASWEFLEKFSKIGIAAMLLTGLVHYRWQLKGLTIVLALCAGFYAVKIGGYFLLGYADVTHHGGPSGMDSNDIALFLAMGFPLLVFGAVEIQNKYLRWGMYFAAAMCVPAVIAGESRGGMLAMAVSIALTVWRRVGSLRTVLIGAVAVPVILMMVPPETMHRYKSIRNYREDISAVGRLNAWSVALRMVEDHPITGIGMSQQTFMDEYVKYQEKPEDWPHVAHSVWLSALAGMGYPGLSLFVLLILATFGMTWRIRRVARDLPDRQWADSYSRGIETSVIAFTVAGTFLSQVGFEYVYAVMLLSVPLMAMVRQERAAVSEPVEVRSEEPAMAVPAQG